MHIDIFSSVISGLSITVITFLGWLTRLTVINGTKIDHVEKNLESKIDHLEEKLEQKIDMMIKNLDEKMDRMDQKMDRQDNEAKERITRLEKYFDVIMQTQIKKNEEQLKMEF